MQIPSAHGSHLSSPELQADRGQCGAVKSNLLAVKVLLHARATTRTMKTTILSFLTFALCLAAYAQTPAPNWQAKAVVKYPDLAVRGTALNKRFVEEVTQRRKTKPEFFTDPKWPMTLADELSKPVQSPEEQAEAAAKAREEAAAVATAKEMAAKAKRMLVQISQVVPGGVIVRIGDDNFSVTRGPEGGGVSGTATGRRIFVAGVKGAAEEQFFAVTVFPNGNYVFNDTGGASRTIEKWVLVPGTTPEKFCK